MKKLLLLLVMLDLLPVIPAQAGISQQNQLPPDKEDRGGVVDSLLTLLKTTKEDTLKVKILNDLSWELKSKGNYQPALNYAKEGKALAEKINFKKGIAASYGNIGIIYYEQGNYDRALENHFASLKIAEGILSEAKELSEKQYAQKRIAGSYNNIGNIFYSQDHYGKALENYFTALKINKEMGNKNWIAINYNNIGIIYDNQGNYDKASENYFASLKIREEIGDKKGIASTYDNIGSFYSDQAASPLILLQKRGELQNKALENYFTSLKIREEIGDKYGIAMSYINIGSLNTDLKKYADAGKWLHKGLELSKEIGAKDFIMTSYENLSLLDSMQGNWKGAYEHHKLYVLYRDSIFNAESEKNLAQSEMQYEYDKKEAIAKKEQEKREQVAAAENRRQKAISWSATGGAGLMLLLAGVSYRNYRNKRKAHEIIAHQKELVEEKQKEIVDSITYAKRIQYSLLAQDKLLAAHLPEHFVLFKPKDIVSGDFYWATKKELPSPGGKGPEVRCFYLACCDSTGHGVPGAFMSLLNISFLNEAVNEKNITAPHEIFNHVRQRLIENMEGGQDGMDASLIKLSGNSVEYAAAHNAPLLIRDNEIIELSKDKMPVGSGPVILPFRLHNLQLQKGDTLYLFTDGYADQFGGEKGKKFKYSKLKELLLSISHKPMSKQKQVLDETFETWKGDLEQVDDVCIIGVRI